MKKKTAIAVAVAWLLTWQAQAIMVGKHWEPDTVYHFRNNRTDTVFKKTVKFDERGNMLHCITDELPEGQSTWHRNKYLYLYDADGRPTDEKRFLWRDVYGGTYELRDSLKYAYDSQGRPIAREQNIFQVVQGNWVWSKYQRDSTVYDAAGNLLVESSESGLWINNSMNIWRKNQKTLRTFSPENKPLTQLVQNGGDDVAANKWTDVERTTFRYNALDSLEEVIVEYADGKSRQRFEYSENKLIEFNDFWEDGAWQAERKEERTFVEDPVAGIKIHTRHAFLYDKSEELFVPMGGNVYEYALSTDSLLSERYEVFEHDAYQVKWRYDYAYGANGLLESVVGIVYGYDDEGIVDRSELLFEYDSHNRLTKETEKGLAGGTVPVELHVVQYAYDDNGCRHHELEKVRDNDRLCDSREVARLFDARGCLLSETIQERDVAQDKLVNKSRKTFEYDGHGNALSGTLEKWDEAAGWIPDAGEAWGMYYNYNKSSYYVNRASRCEMRYVKTKEGEEVDAVDEARARSLSVTVYPNPTAGIVTVRAEGCTVEQIVLYDMFGLQLAACDTHTVELGHLSAGMYLLRIITDGGTSLERIIRK